MKPCLLSLAPLLLFLMLACTVLRTARVGVMAGEADTTDGSVPVLAGTLSVEPFAGVAEDTGPSEQQLALAIKQRDEYAAMVRDMEGHVCEPTPCIVEHVEPEHPHAWWEQPETFIYVAGALIALLGGAAGVKKRKKRLAESVVVPES